MSNGTPDGGNYQVDVLEHFGVKGMKWGVRRNQNRPGGTDSKATKPKKLSRKEVRAEKRAFYEKKANDILKTAAKDHEVLIKTYAPGDTFPTIVTGKEFINYMGRGGYMNARATDIWAQKDKTGVYVQKEAPRFVRSDKKPRN